MQSTFGCFLLAPRTLWVVLPFCECYSLVVKLIGSFFHLCELVIWHRTAYIIGSVEWVQKVSFITPLPQWFLLYWRTVRRQQM